MTLFYHYWFWIVTNMLGKMDCGILLNLLSIQMLTKELIMFIKALTTSNNNNIHCVLWYPGYQSGAPPGYQPLPGQMGPYAGQPITVTTTNVVVVGGCPACRVGILEDDFTLLGVCCAILFFPLGKLLLCAVYYYTSVQWCKSVSCWICLWLFSVSFMNHYSQVSWEKEVQHTGKKESEGYPPKINCRHLLV